ncbi:MAG: peptidase [Desulfobulbus propionicus]|nr:MAG: peptidase [Desulfobulbus propionicus]
MRQRILSFLERAREGQFALLKELVELQSHTNNIEGVNRVGRAMASALAATAMQLEVRSSSTVGDHLVFRSPACTGTGVRPILLVGHMDTVFPPDSPFKTYREEGELVRGPGVIDMKGGLVVAVQALLALHRTGLLARIPVIFICNSDEETGSLDSRELITREAEKAQCGLIFECGGLGGGIVTGRKGKIGYRVEAFGRAGHAAFAKPGPKPSALLALAHAIIALEALNDPGQGITLNVGRVEGGIGPTTIPERAVALVDTRVKDSAAAVALEARLHKVLSPKNPDTRLVVEAETSRLPMEQTAPNRYLFSLVAEQAGTLGQHVVEEFRSGVSDANIIAASGTPVLDGLGPIGDQDHSDREYMVRQSLPERCALATMTILELWSRANQGELFRE